MDRDHLVTLLGAVRCVPTLLLAGLIAGCGSLSPADNLQASIDRAVRLERRCRAVEDAVAISGDFAESIKTAVFYRLSGACFQRFDDDCLGSENRTSFVEAANEAKRLQVQLEQQFEGALQDRDEARQSLDKVQRTYARVALTAEKYFGQKSALSDGTLWKDLNSLKTALNLTELKGVAQPGTTGAACTTRSGCMQALEAVLSKNQAVVSQRLVQLRADAQDAASEFRQEATDLSTESKGLEETLKAGSANGEALSGQLADLARDTQKIADALARMAQHASLGIDSVGLLYEGDLADASRVFMGQMLWSRTAERTLSYIDSTVLIPLDRIADKLDDKFFLAASIASEVYDDKIQGALDRAYVQTIWPLFPSLTARVAFANAACQYLETPSTNQARSSLLRPFVFSMLTNVHLEVDKDMRRLPVDNTSTGDEAWPADFQSFLSTKVEANQVPTAVEISALCAKTEVVLRAAGLQSAHAAALADCGQTSYMVSTNDDVAAHTTEAFRASERAPQRLAELTSISSAPGAATSPPAKQFDRLCEQLMAKEKGISCTPSASTAVIEIRTYFAPGATRDSRIDAILVVVAEELATAGPDLEILVEGFASRSLKACRRGAQSKQDCGSGWNQHLANERAKWAAEILSKREASLPGSIRSEGSGDVSALSADSDLDRRIRVVLSGRAATGREVATAARAR